MSRSENHTARATALIALSSCCFGSLSVLTTIITRAGTPLVPAMFWRYFIAALVLAGIVLAKDRTDFRFLPSLLLVGGVGQALITYLSLRSLDYIAVGPLAFLFYTYPAWVAAISAARGTDRMTPKRVLALCVALSGVVVIIGSPLNASLNPTGVMLALAAAVAYGAYVPVISTLQTNVSPMTVALHITSGATVVFAAVAFAHGQIGEPVSLTSGVGIATQALICTAGAFWLFLAGLAVLGPVRTAIVATVEPFYTTLLGAAILGEKVSIRTGIGGILIAVAVIVIQRAGGKQDGRVVAA